MTDEKLAKEKLEDEAGVYFEYSRAKYNEDTKTWVFSIANKNGSRVFRASCKEDFAPYIALSNYLKLPFEVFIADYVWIYGEKLELIPNEIHNKFCYTVKGWLSITEIVKAFTERFGAFSKNDLLTDITWKLTIDKNECSSSTYKNNEKPGWPPISTRVVLCFTEIEDKIIKLEKEKTENRSENQGLEEKDESQSNLPDDARKDEGNVEPVVAITTFDAKGVERDDVEFLMNVFTSSFANLGVTNILDSASFDKIVGKQYFQPQDWSDINKIINLGKAVKATHVVVGQFINRASNLFLTAKILDIKSEVIIAFHMDKVGNIDDFFDKSVEFCKKLITQIKEETFPLAIPKHKKITNTMDNIASSKDTTQKNKDEINKNYNKSLSEDAINVSKAKTNDMSPLENATPQATQTIGLKKQIKYEIGDEGPGCGTVFYFSEEGFMVYDGLGGTKTCHYLEMSKESLEASLWYPEGVEVTTQVGLGYGKSNTYRILQASEGTMLTSKNCAAHSCFMYHTETAKQGEWFLPSEFELDLMYKNQKEKILDSCQDEWHWSSSEYNKYYAWLQNFFNGNRGNYSKKHQYCSVRAVRAF